MTEQNNIKVMYFHGKTVDGTRYTVSGVIKDDDLHMGIAICSHNDQFSRKIGRTISTGRVLNQKDNNVGHNLISLYSDILVHEHETDTTFPENYFVGRESEVFVEYVRHYNHLTQKELQLEFKLLRK